jgi:hypothetical protein
VVGIWSFDMSALLLQHWWSLADYTVVIAVAACFLDNFYKVRPGLS